MLIKALLFSLVSFAAAMVIGFFVAAIIKVIASLLKGKEEVAPKNTKR
ncbi:MAG: hypothetical protein ABR958_03995 [Dehalococcoidales bacterium]